MADVSHAGKGSDVRLGSRDLADAGEEALLGGGVDPPVHRGRLVAVAVVVRAVKSLDGMTANFSHIPPDVLERISTRITNEIRSVGRVFYDITNKPPGTIEME